MLSNLRKPIVIVGRICLLVIFACLDLNGQQRPTRAGSQKPSRVEQSPISKEKTIEIESPIAAEAARQKGGAVKAMLYVDSNGKIVRCFNSFLTGTAGNTLPCGFTTRLGSDPESHLTVINLGFKVNDRFILTTPVIGNRFQGESAHPTTAPIYFHPDAADTVVVTTSRPEQAFMFFVF